jgi:GNAT superfamily N-acetyltransferase
MLCAMARKEDSRLIAYDKSTGDIKWQVKLPELAFGHASPTLIDVKGTPQLLVMGGNSDHAMLAVDPELQGRGLSRVLMNAVEEYCRAAECNDLEIEVVNLREELPAFYIAMGFVSVDTAPFPDMSKLRREAHMVRMTKRLR